MPAIAGFQFCASLLYHDRKVNRSVTSFCKKGTQYAGGIGFIGVHAGAESMPGPCPEPLRTCISGLLLFPRISYAKEKL